MTLTNDSASLYAQLFLVLLVVLAIEGRGISYGNLGRFWKWCLITGRWLIAGMCLSGMIVATSHVALPSSERTFISEESAFWIVQVFFYSAVVGLIAVFSAMQIQETTEKLRGE